MRYRVLGTTTVLRPDGTAVPLGGARLRALLTVLALRAGRTVPASALVDEVWGDQPPADPHGALQALVGRLRRVLGAGEIASAEAGYRLTAAPDAVDLHRFARLAAEGRTALDRGEAPRAAALLDEAFGLWREPPLPDLPERTAEAAHWERLAHMARTARLSAALALGHAEQALPDLAALCLVHPLDEPLQALRLRALRDTGRAAEALDAYARVRATLVERLGTEPGPELRALHTALVRGDPHRREGPPAPGGPEPRPGGDVPASPAPAAPAGVGNLRARLTSFVGREAEVAALREDLTSARLVTLLGPGGSGKTRLSQETAETLAGAFPHGVWLAELAPVSDPEAVPAAVLGAVGARETVLRGVGAEEMRVATERHGDDALSRLTEYCAPRHMVLLLDNCEHVVDAAAHLAQTLLERCPQLTVIATSREPLGVPGERLRPVDPLTEPYAVRLFAERGAAARPGFRADEDPGAVAEICRRLDGLPLAIELAAARLRMLTPRQIADRLDDRFRLLTSGSRTVLPRQQTLRAVVDWSWDLLDERERGVLGRLSVFAGGCDLPAAEAVCATGRVPPEDVAGLVGSLVDKSLVVAAPSPAGGMRYRLLETVGEYAAARLAEAEDEAAARAAHLVHYRELARTTDPELRGFRQREAITRLEGEYENLRAALRKAIGDRNEQEALCLVLSLAWYWQIRGPRAEALQWSSAAAALGPDPFGPGAEPARPLYTSCTEQPPPMRPEVLAEARRGVHLVHLAHMDMQLEQWREPAGRARLRTVTEVYRPGLPQTCRPPGNIWFYAVVFTADLARLGEVVDETVRACRELGYRWELALALQNRANLLAGRSDVAGDARADADEALRLFRELGDIWGAAEALSSRGEAFEHMGAIEEAGADYEQAATYAGELGAVSQMGILQARLAGMLIESGESDKGEALLRDLLDQDLPQGNEALPAACMFLAMHLGRTGRTTEARETLERLRIDFEAASFMVFDGILLRITAWLDTLEGRYAEALEHLCKGLDSSLDQLALMIAPHLPSGYFQIAALTLARRGTGTGEREDILLAARLLGAAEGQLPEGHCLTSLDRELFEETERHIRDWRPPNDTARPRGDGPDGEAEGIDAGTLARCRAEGAALSLDESLALVRALAAAAH
ncbi:BTAD domain-containing putative transcriptional regulator [Streptomyces sp. NPDC049954]|uniref:BTAD domain-containing putative transcriptional regulator n=1 Tax=Streptomyces sp. NPDC049954 TaxID=3155779 RepID=UPI003425B86D